MTTRDTAAGAERPAVVSDIRAAAYAVSARAVADHRAVLGWLRGERDLPRGALGERITRAAAELGVAPPPRKAG